MNKKLKILTSLFILSILILNPCISVSAKNQQSNKPGRRKNELIRELKCHGMSDKSIEILQQDEPFFETLKKSEEICVNEQYVKVNTDTNESEVVTDKDELDYIKEVYENDSLENLDDIDDQISLFGTLSKKLSVYQKQTIITVKTGNYLYGQPVYAVGFSIQWLKIPTNRLTDVFSIAVDSTMSIVTGNSKYPIRTQTYAKTLYREYYSNTSSLVEQKYEYNYGSVGAVTTKFGVVAGKWNLKDDYQQIGVSAHGYTVNTIRKTVVDMQASISFYTFCKDTSVIGFDAWSEYYHQIESFEINPSVSISANAKGPSAGLSFSAKELKYMDEMTPNLSLFTQIK